MICLGKCLKRLLDIFAKPAVDLARRKPGTIEQDLNLDGKRGETIRRRQLAGEVRGIDAGCVEFRSPCWKLKKNRQA
jgi:hypothetical protein